MSKKDKLISVDHLKWNVGGIKCGTLTVDYLNWILDHEEPAVDAVPVRHGKWIFKPTFPNDDSEFPMGSLVCSICGSHHSNETPCNYCDNCGARMDEE